MKFNSKPIIKYLNENKISVFAFCETYNINKIIFDKLLKETQELNSNALSTIIKISIATEIDLIDFLEK